MSPVCEDGSRVDESDLCFERVLCRSCWKGGEGAVRGLGGKNIRCSKQLQSRGSARLIAKAIEMAFFFFFLLTDI